MGKQEILRQIQREKRTFFKNTGLPIKSWVIAENVAEMEGITIDDALNLLVQLGIESMKKSEKP